MEEAGSDALLGGGYEICHAKSILLYICAKSGEIVMIPRNW